MDLVISIFILVFNSIQIAAIVNIKRKLTNAQMFILNLAASDLLLGCIFCGRIYSNSDSKVS